MGLTMLFTCDKNIVYFFLHFTLDTLYYIFFNNRLRMYYMLSIAVCVFVPINKFISTIVLRDILFIIIINPFLYMEKFKNVVFSYNLKVTDF